MRAGSVPWQGKQQFHQRAQAEYDCSLWTALTELLEATKRCRVQSHMILLSGLKMKSGEKETTSQKQQGSNWIWLKRWSLMLFFTATILKDVLRDFDSVVSVLNFGTEKWYYEMKQDLVNLAATRGLCVSSETSIRAFRSAGRKPIVLQEWKMGHRAKACHSQETRTCFNCGQKRHLAPSCRKWHPNGGCGSCQSSSRHSSVDFFSFGAFRAACYKFLNDSGCNNLMMKNKEMFSDLDEGFFADVCKANRSRSEIRGRGTVRCWVKKISGSSCILELRKAFWVPSWRRIWCQ